MNRREYLAAFTTTIPAALAGCISRPDDTTEPTSTAITEDRIEDTTTEEPTTATTETASSAPGVLDLGDPATVAGGTTMAVQDVHEVPYEYSDDPYTVAWVELLDVGDQRPQTIWLRPEPGTDADVPTDPTPGIDPYSDELYHDTDDSGWVIFPIEDVDVITYTLSSPQVKWLVD